MDIRSVSIYMGEQGKKIGDSAKNPFLQIGKKGQVVQGTITKVADQLTISFQGVEVAVNKNAVHDPKEGETRNFQIKDVSQDSIVLKEIGRKANTGETAGVMKTSVASSSYSFADYVEASQNAAEAQKEASQDLAMFQGDDYEQIEGEEGSVEDAAKEAVERATARSKARRQWQEARHEDYVQLREELEEGMEKLQANGFLSEKSMAQIQKSLQDAGIPVTKENLDNVVAALGMSQSALEITDQSRAYVVGQNLAPTIDNLYQGKYSVYGAGKMSRETDNDFAAYADQIENILQECGRNDQKNLENAKWLFEKELPVNSDTLQKMEQLDQIQSNMTADRVLQQIIYAMTSGGSAKDAVLDDSMFLVARDAVHDFNQITDGTIIAVADRESPLVNLELLRQQEATASQTTETIPEMVTPQMSETQVLQVTLKRQLEEIRQKMTLQAAYAMEQKGIHVDTESLDNIVKQLRQMEKEYYNAQVGDSAWSVGEEEFSLMEETLTKKEEIAAAPVWVLGSSARKQELLTLNELHKAVSSETANRQEFLDTYETVGTQVRKDLGDSVQKAFQNIPHILEELGMEDNQHNERAVRILGYNRMELTPDNLKQIKEFDEKVNRAIDNLKPATVLELIRRGENPLNMPLDDLNQELEQINEEKGITSQEKYSRFLWQLEKNHEITPEERAGYIGVYRLLHQIEKTDGAVIGAVLDSDQELTLGNLLTQARTRKKNGLDAIVDDNRELVGAAATGNSITDQIETGFAPDANQEQYQSQEENRQEIKYYQELLSKSLDEISPEKIQKITDGDVEKLLDVSVETFLEQLQRETGNAELKREFYEEQAREIREGLEESQQAQEYLEKLNIEPTISNLLAAKDMLKEKMDPYREGYKRKNVLEKKTQDTLEQALTDTVESVDEPQEFMAQCEKNEKIMEDILTKSYEQADITIEDLKNLRRLGRGIHLQGALRRSQSYDIPIKTGDSITSLNLTIVNGTDESGKIHIHMEDDIFGNISMDFKAGKDSVKGLILCDQRDTFEKMQNQNASIEKEVEKLGYEVKNISYGMDFKSRNDFTSVQKEETIPTRGLYRIAKVLVRAVAEVVKEK